MSIFQVKLVLDQPFYKHAYSSPVAKYTIAINNFYDFFSTSTGIEVEVGTKTHIRVTPIQHVATEGFKTLSLEKRKCRYLDEDEDIKMFNYYTYKSCMFECKLRNVIQTMGCTAWYLPQSEEWSGTPLCTASYLDWFLFRMGSREATANCDCLPDCEEVTFETKRTIQQIHTCLLYTSDAADE